MYLDGYEQLGLAVIEAAARDYERALIALKKNPNNYKARDTKIECEKFFEKRINDFTLAEIDGTFILKKIRKRVEKRF